MTEPQLPFDPPLPLASHPRATAEFARKYNEYRQAALEPSPLFADFCLYVRDNQVGETQLPGLLKANLKIPLKSAVEEARHILYFIKGADAEIWQDLSNGKITVSDARKNSSRKLVEREDKKKMKPESTNVPTEVSAEPASSGQPESAAPAVPEEKLTRVKHRNPFINNQPLSAEEHAERVAAAEERLASMTPEEREASRAAALKAAGVLTPEERKERQAADQEREKARLEKLSPAQKASLALDKARAKKLMAEEYARLDAKKRRSL